MPRGGKREGAGRKNTGRTSKVIRISSDIDLTGQQIEQVIEMMEKWSALSNGDKPARWYFLKKLMSEYNQIIKEDN